MGETLNLHFRQSDDGSYELQVRESWSRHTVRGSFTPPYTTRQLDRLLKKLNAPERKEHELRDVGYHLFRALCGSETPGTARSDSSEQSVQALFRGVIQRTLQRRGTVALTFSFAPGCDEFVRYPWELLHNGELFLLASGVFTLTRAIQRPDEPIGCELPVRLPMRVLYISATPSDCSPLETGRSLDALGRALANLTEDGGVILDKFEQVTYDDLVSYMSTCGGADVFNEAENTHPCYVVHFDGHGVFGKLCQNSHCEQMNEPEARKCSCGTSLQSIKPQTYLCFCNAAGKNEYIDTQALREIFVSSDVRLAVFSACETAAMSCETERHQIAFDSTLATALVRAQIPAVVAMPFSVEDDLSPTFVYHFYESLAQGRTLEEALARARHAMLPKHRDRAAWFIPVLYRHIGEGQEGPVALLADQDTPEEHDHPLAHLGAETQFIGREKELRELGFLLTSAAHGGERNERSNGAVRLHPGIHHIVLTGPAGIGKSALALAAAWENREQFSGGVIGLSLQGGKLFGEALVEMAHYLHITEKATHLDNILHRSAAVMNVLRTRASRELPCLIVLDSFEEVKEHTELEHWYHFLCDLPQEVVVLLTSRYNPTSVSALEGNMCRWYEYGVSQMTDTDLMNLFTDRALSTGLYQRIHLDDPQQQTILRELCTLLGGYPLGAELIFGTARKIEGRLFTPEAATRSLAEVRDQLRDSSLPGITAALDVAYRRLTLSARLLLSYLATFKLPFSTEQIMLVVAPVTSSAEQETVRLQGEHGADHAGDAAPADLAHSWQDARAELVQASFIQFDGRVYTIHPQVRNFALVHLPLQERSRVQRVVASYYQNLVQRSPEEWFAAFEHLVSAGEAQDLQDAVRLAVRASWAMSGRGHTEQLQMMLRKAETSAVHIGDKTGEGQLQCCLGAILRHQGQYLVAVACLTRSLLLLREQNEQYDVAWALYELAMLEREEGNFRQAGEYAQEALQVFRDIADAKGEAWMQMVLGEVSRGRGDYYRALGHFNVALTSFREMSNDDGMASTLHDRGLVYEALGKYSEALTDYHESLRIFNTRGLRPMQAWVLTDRSIVFSDQGKLEQAEQECSQALTIFREEHARRGEGWALRAMGIIAHGRANISDARSYFEEAEAIFNELGDTVDLARVQNALGALAFDEQDYLTAKNLYEQALLKAEDQGARQIAGRALRGLGDVDRVMGQYKEAAAKYQQAYDIALELDTPAEQCAALRRQGLLKKEQHEYSEALDSWLKALKEDKRVGHIARAHLEADIHTLVEEQHLEEICVALRQKYGLD